MPPLATQTYVDRDASTTPVTEPSRRINAPDDFSRAVIDSVVSKRGETISISVQSEAEAIKISTRIELLLMTVGMGSGSVSARVAPSFLEHNYPAMRALTEALDGSGLSGMWSSQGGRSIRLVESWQMFISVDTPSIETTSIPSRPDTLLEVIAADLIPTSWFRTRVAPRASRCAAEGP